MRVLALETSEYVSSLALVAEGQVLAEQTFASRMSLCETLTQRLGELLALPEATPLCGGEPRLDGLAVSLGPGSFTGLRVGLATAKALAHVCGLPLVGVCTQEAIAAAAEEPPGTVMGVVQHARQGHVYVGLWEKTAGGTRPCSTLRVAPVAELGASLGHTTQVVLGPAAEMVLEAAPELLERVRVRTAMPAASAVGRLGAGRMMQADPAAHLHLQPIYILASQAERTKNLVVTPDAALPGLLPQRQLRIRPGTLEDLRHIVRIERASFAAPWPEASLAEEVSRGRGGVFLVAECDGRVAGYAGAWIYAGEVHIHNVAVDPDLRRSGLGEALLLALIESANVAECDLVVLEHRASNTPAAQLYAKLGFERIGVRKGYYQESGEDAIVVALHDLRTARRQEALAELRRLWEERYEYDLRLDL